MTSNKLDKESEAFMKEKSSPEDGLHSEDVLEKTHAIYQAPDGGWGWVVCGASFICMVILDGMLFSFGVFYLDLLDYFQASNGKTALIGSLFMGMSMAGAPIASGLVNLCGIRPVAIMGSVGLSICFVVSSFATSVEFLAISYGFLGGLSVCMVYIPSILVIGFYFDKRRGIANGIAASGSGIGAFVYAILCAYLQKEYNWRGALLILSAIAMNTIVCSVLYRPIKVKVPEPVIRNDADLVIVINASESISKCKDESDGIPPLNQGVDDFSKRQINHHFLHGYSTLNHNSHKSTPKNKQFDYLIPASTDICQSEPRLCVKSITRLSKSNYSQSSEMLQIQQTPRKAVHKTITLRPLEKVDIFYSGSVRRLANVGSSNDILTTGNKEPLTENATLSLKKTTNKLFKFGYKLLAFDLLKNPIFYLVVIFHTLWTAHSTILTITPAFAMQNGVSKSDAAFILSIVGVTNTIGRLVTGWISDRDGVNSAHIVAFSLITGGSISFCFAISTSYFAFVFESAVFGFCMGTWTSLRPIVIVDILGLDNLTNAFGLVGLFQGLAFCIGPPVAGMLYDTFGSYKIPYIMAGISFTISGIICLILPSLVLYMKTKRVRSY